jgi:hypothetical protein
MGGIYDGDVERVRKALHSKAVIDETLNVAFAFASATKKRNEEILKLLTEAGAQPLPQVDSKTLESYAGTYKGEQGISAEITVRDGRLFAAPAGQQPMSLWPLDQVTFKPVAMDQAKIVFNVENGEVKSLSFFHGGYEIELKPQRGTKDTGQTPESS